MNVCFEKSSRKRVFVISLLIGAVSLCGWSQEGSWKAVGPAGGEFVGVVIHPTDELQVTAFTASPSNTYRSYDGGVTWELLSGFGGDTLYDFYIHDPLTIFALTYRTMYKSVDGGDTWTTSTISSQSEYPYQIACDPNDPDIVYSIGFYYSNQNNAWTYQMVFAKSTDGGQRWRSTRGFSYDYFYPINFVVSKSNPDVMYVVAYIEEDGAYTEAIFRSVDGGSNWTNVSASIATEGSLSFNDIAIHPTDENRVFATGSYFYSSNDGGETWTRSAQRVYGYSIFFDAFDSEKIFIGGNNGFSYSADGGNQWQTYSNQTNPLLGVVNYFAFSPFDPSTMFLGTSIGLYKSEDAGQSWNTSHRGIFNSTISAMAMAPSDPKTIYIEYQNDSEYVTRDRGETWERRNLFKGSGHLVALQVHPSDPHTVIAMDSYNGSPIYTSNDAGLSWEEVDTYIEHGNTLAQDSKNPDVMYAGGVKAVSDVERIVVSKSEDGGSTWNEHFILPNKGEESYYYQGCNWIAVSRANPMILYVAARDDYNVSVFRSDNGGGVWKNITNNLRSVDPYSSSYLDANCILCLPTNEYTLYLATDDNVYVSTNGGNTWTATMLNKGAVALRYDFVTERIYAATTENGVYYLENGRRWGKLGRDLDRTQCTSLCVDPTDGSLYVGTYGRGVWRFSTDVAVPDWSLY